MATLTIGKLARAAGVGVETVRFYERVGLLEPPPRTPAGYRQYAPEAVDRLGFIKHAQRLGFTLTEVADLLRLHRDVVLCEDVKRRAVAKMATIDAKVAALLAVKAELRALVERCDAVCTTSCTVLLPSDSCAEQERTHA